MPEALRVAMIIQAYHPRIGGAEKLVGALAPKLVDRQVELHILTRRYPGSPAFEIVDGAAVHRLSSPGDSGRVQKALASAAFTLSALPLLRRLRPHVIHAHELLSPATTAVTAKALFGASVVATVHGGGRGPRSELARLLGKPFGRRRMRLFCRMIDRFQCISRDIDQQLEELGVPSEKRLHLSNGVDADFFHPLSETERTVLRQSLGFSPKDRIVLYVGRLAPEKSVEKLIRLWPEIQGQNHAARLVIVGSGPDEEKLKHQAMDGILFTGPCDDVRSWLQIADLFVLPSEAEGISIALLEAMSCALPVLATSGGGNPEVIHHGENGWLVPPDERNALGQAVGMLLDRPDLSQKLAINARERIVSAFSLSRTVEALLELYRSLAEAKPGESA